MKSICRNEDSFATREKRSPEELSEIRREAGRLGGIAKGANGNGREKVTMRFDRRDHAVISEFAKAYGMTICAAIHNYAESIAREFPEVGRAAGWGC